MKHPTSKRQGFAPRKVTGKHLLDWKHLATSFRRNAKRIQAHTVEQNINFITFCDLWLINHPIKSRLSSILWQIILILDVWNLTGEELSIIISNLALMIQSYNESRKDT